LILINAADECIGYWTSTIERMSMEGNDAHAQHPSADIHQPDSSGVASSEIHFHLRAMRALGTMRSTTSRRLCRQGRPTRPRRTTHQTSRLACLL